MTRVKKFVIVRIRYRSELNNDIWSERFDTEEAAIEWLEHYFNDDFGEYIVIPVYIFNDEEEG